VLFKEIANLFLGPLLRVRHVPFPLADEFTMDFITTAQNILERVREYVSNLQLFSKGGSLLPKLVFMGVVLYISNRLYKRITRKSIEKEIVLVTGNASLS
jgi:hypothetical protein